MHTTISSFLRAVLAMSVLDLIFLWFGLHSVYSPTAPSLRSLIPNGSLIRCKPVQAYHHHLSFYIMTHYRIQNNKDPSFGHVDNYLEWPVLLHLRLLLHVQSLLSFWRGPNPRQCPDVHFFNLD
jgi:hypothetical protein